MRSIFASASIALYTAFLLGKYHDHRLEWATFKKAIAATREKRMKGKEILVIGAGLGGLSAALALQRIGCRVAVFEIGETLREFGAGVVITPNAMHALNFLGVGKQLAALGKPGQPPVIRDHRSGAILREAQSADAILARYGENFYHMHRGDLHRVLSEAVRANDEDCIKLGHGLIAVSQSEECVTAHFSNGVVATGAALIGCDGNASAVRNLIFHDAPVDYSGQAAYRAMVPMEAVSKAILEMPNALWPGPGAMLLHYPVSQGKIMNVIGLAVQPAWQEEGWAIPTNPSELESRFVEFHADARALLAAIPEGALFKWGLRDRDPLANWVSGRIAMLGDAAHPMSPFLGQGAVMAIEDGVVLGRCVAAAGTIEEAFSRYEAARKDRANGVQLASRRRARALQGRDEAGPSSGIDAEGLGLFTYKADLVPV